MKVWNIFNTNLKPVFLKLHINKICINNLACCCRQYYIIMVSYCILYLAIDIYIYTYVIVFVIYILSYTCISLILFIYVCIYNLLNLINNSTKLFIMLSIMFNAMLTHGVNPEYLLLSTLISIPKDNRGSMNSSDN